MYSVFDIQLVIYNWKEMPSHMKGINFSHLWVFKCSGTNVELGLPAGSDTVLSEHSGLALWLSQSPWTNFVVQWLNLGY